MDKELPQLSEKIFIAPLPKQFEEIVEGERNINGNLEFERT